MNTPSSRVRGFRGHSLLISASTAAILSFVVAGAAQAQPVPAADNDQSANKTGPEQAAESTVTTTPDAGVTGSDIVVTGSRIARRDYEANSPIVTVGQQLFEQSSTAAIEQNLNKLPQFTPAKNPTQGGDIQPTATNTPGSATVSLRGIGANRSLVLIDGRRATPGNATGVVDITTIPSAAIDRVEIISGGASSTYGADAVAGVTNFILKKNFTGLELDASSNISEEGDGFEYQISGIMGANFDDGRGNISIAMSTNKRDASFQKGRDIYRDLWSNPTIGGSGFFLRRPGVNLGGAPNPVAQGTINAIFAGANPAVPTAGFTAYTNADGTVFSGTDFSARGGANRFQSLGINSKITALGTIAPNFTDGYLILPLTRYNFLARGNYEINDWISVFGQGYYSKVHTETVQEPGPIFAGWGVSVPYGTQTYTGDPTRGIPSSLNANGTTNAAYRAGGQYGLNCAATGGCTTAQVFPLPAQLQSLLLNRQNPNANFTLTSLLPENRTAVTDVNTFNITAGINGKIPPIDWTYELFVNHGESDTFALQTGVYSLSRVRALLTSPNFGYGFQQQGNAEQGGFGASTGKCTTGLNFYAPPSGGFSNDCLEAIRADLKNRSQIKQSIWETNFQGPLFQLPGGELRAAFGASYRETNYSFLNDTLTTQGRSFQDQALGIYPSGNSFGRITAKEAYGELLVPIIKDLPLVKSLSIELGGRISDYNTTGKSYTYKALGDWEVTDWLRFRGGYNRAERAPNIAELFLAPQQTFAGTTFGDVCSRANLAPYGANPAINASGAARVETLCRALMDRTGDLTAKDFYYSNPQPVGGGFAFPTVSGNGALRPEKADTYTAGVVIASPFETPAFKRLRLTVDYYYIKVKDAIGQQSVDIALQQCVDPQFNANYDPNSPFCAGIGRNTQNGGLGNVILSYFNNGRFTVSGIDAQLDWSFDLGPGTVNLNSLLNYSLGVKSAELSTLPAIDYVGSFGPSQNGLNGGSYRYRLLTTLGYSLGGARVALQWQRLPSIDDASKPVNDFNNRPTTITGASAYDLFNLQTSYSVTSDIGIRFGVDNLFNKRPPLSGTNTTANLALGQLPGGTYQSNYYDIIGRRYYFGVQSKF